MLIGSLILITTIFSTNGFPYSLQTETSQTAHRNFEQQGSIILQNSEQQVTFKPSEQQKVIFQPEEQDEIFQSSEQEKTLLFENIQQNYEREEIDKNYFLSDGAKFAKQQNDFTISCIGPNRICINKNNCVNGFYAKNISYSSFTKIQQCRVYDQVCCTIKKELERGFETSGRNVKNKSTNISLQTGQLSTNLSQNEPNPIGSSIQNIFVIPTHAQIGCAAALLCVEEQFCTIDGTISSEPVTLSEKEILRRVPTSSCQNPDNGIIGKCCRDPNYTDPWPTGNLPANYSGGFDEQGFPTFLNIAKAKLSNSPQSKTSKTTVKYYPMEQRSKKVEQKFEPTLVPENSDIFTKTLIPPIVGQNEKNAFNAVQRKIRCGIRNKIRQESEIEDSKTIFAEIPWQAMVLHSKERKILCSGVLIGIQEVLTAANCVDSLSPEDVSIKLGEWKLGYESKRDEPLPFQIIDVSSISIHPGYNKQGHGGYDLATLHLNSSIIFDLHINPLCLPDSKYLSRNDRPCISTGWGKSILQAHYAGAIMRAVDMDILSKERCKEQSLRTNLEVNDVDGIICVTPKKEINNVCETDIGSPLACQNENGFYELAGIYSRDTGCLPTNQIAVFAPLDVSWLKRVTFSSNESPSEKRKTNSTHDEESSSKDYRKSTLSTDNQYLPPNRK